MARHCPNKDKYQEAPGRSEKNVSQTSCLEAKDVWSHDDLTITELQTLLIQRRLEQETQTLEDVDEIEVACHSSRDSESCWTYLSPRFGS